MGDLVRAAGPDRPRRRGQHQPGPPRGAAAIARGAAALLREALSREDRASGLRSDHDMYVDSGNDTRGTGRAQKVGSRWRTEFEFTTPRSKSAPPPSNLS